MDTTQFFNANEDEKKPQGKPDPHYNAEEGGKDITEKEKVAGVDAATTFKEDQEQDLDDLVHRRGGLQNKKDKLDPDQR